MKSKYEKYLNIRKLDQKIIHLKGEAYMRTIFVTLFGHKIIDSFIRNETNSFKTGVIRFIASKQNMKKGKLKNAQNICEMSFLRTRNGKRAQNQLQILYYAFN